jgi:hypothetical protein
MKSGGVVDIDEVKEYGTMLVRIRNAFVSEATREGRETVAQRNSLLIRWRCNPESSVKVTA